MQYNIVSEDNLNIRLDRFLASNLNQLSRTKLKRLITIGEVTFNGIKITNPKEKVSRGIYLVNYVSNENNLEKKQMSLDIRYEDDDLIIINKHAGLTVHPGAGNYQDTLVNGLIAHFGENLSAVNGNDKPGIVHRLDKDTSGLLIVAKNDQCHVLLSKMLEERTIKREYFALVYGMLSPSNGRIEANIARSNKDRTKMMVSDIQGRYAATNYETKAIYSSGDFSLIKCKLETGRTHQIRVHLDYVGHSIVGDKLYGNNSRRLLRTKHSGFIKNNLDRQFLHAYKLEFIHPVSKKIISLESKLPENLENIIEHLS